MEMTTSNSISVKAARRRRGVKGFRGSGVKGARNLDFGFLIGPKVKGVKMGKWEGGRRILDFGFWVLDVGFMEEVERSFLQRSRGRKWKVKSGKWKFFVKVNPPA